MLSWRQRKSLKGIKLLKQIHKQLWKSHTFLKKGVQKQKKKGKNIFNLDGRTFTALSNSDNGEVGNNTLFYYSQTDNIISADYYGGQIMKGNLIGKQLENGEFDFFYHHINSIGELKIGKCLSKAKMLDDGRLKLFEKWQWLCDDMSNGESELIEIINKSNIFDFQI